MRTIFAYCRRHAFQLAIAGILLAVSAFSPDAFAGNGAVIPMIALATLGSTYVDLIDAIKQADPKGDDAVVIELLKQQNPMLEDAIAVECNQGAEHLHTVRTGLPAVSWGALYQGIVQSKSNKQMVKDTTGFIEALSSVDKRVLELAGDKKKALQTNEALSFMESMSQEAARGIIYHDTATTPEKIKGICARYSVIGGGGAGNQVIDAGGTGGDNTSILFMTWGERYTHLLYPKGTKAGLLRQNMGGQRLLDDEGNPFYVEEEKFTWHLGVAVKDWRYNARVANIDVSALQAGTVDLYKFMRQAFYKLPTRIRRSGSLIGRQAIYCNRTVLEALDSLAYNGGSSDSFARLTPMEVEGQEVLTYRNIPIREMDAMLNTEARVLAAA